MIVRILGEGQFDVADSAVDRLNRLDDEVEKAVESGDEDAFTAALEELLKVVRTLGAPHDLEGLAVSDAVLSPADATITDRKSAEQGKRTPERVGVGGRRLTIKTIK